MKENSKSVEKAIAEKYIKKYIDYYLDIYDHVKVDRKRLLSFIEDESRLKELKGNVKTTFGLINRTEYNEIAYLRI